VYTFVVEGEFDLYGTGRATPEGTKDAKVLIRRYGGRVIDQIGMDTDFIVIGSEPTRQQQPAETASAQEWKAYREQLKVYERFNEIKLLAESMQIPILNPNKFLAFIGYAPTKADR
jgi:aspartate-semialdehyde dehydrogenase